MDGLKMTREIKTLSRVSAAAAPEVPRTRLKPRGDPVLSVAAPKLGNQLPLRLYFLSCLS